MEHMYNHNMRKATVYDIFGTEKIEYGECPQPEKVLEYRKQREYGQKKRIKP